MAVVSVSEAARLVKKSRTSLYSAFKSGQLSKTVMPDGSPGVDTSELLRKYGQLHSNPITNTVQHVLRSTDMHSVQDGAHRADALPVHIQLAIEQERNKNLERVLAIEADLRRVKDQVTDELRAHILEKNRMIQQLESKVVKLLEYTKPAQQAAPEAVPAEKPAAARKGFRGWFRRG